MAVFPDALWDKNVQNIGNDGAADDTLAQAADYNEVSDEVAEIETFLQAGVLRLFRNDTGSQLDAGDLVYISGRDAVDLPTVTKARANSATTMAEFVVVEDVLDGANGNIARRIVIRGLDTNGRAEGDRVYLSSAVAGEWDATAPSGANFAQLVGRVTEVNVATGEVEFFIDKSPIPDGSTLEYAASDVLQVKALGIDTAELAADAVTPAKIADDAVQKEHLADTVADGIPLLAAITKDAEGTVGADTIRFTIQVKDIQGNNIGKRCKLLVWVSPTEFGDHQAVTNMQPTALEFPIVTDAAFLTVTDAAGQALIDVEVAGAATKWLMVAMDNETASLSGTWAA